ncbi:sigma54 specific transcriptional regulator, Fis family [Desulfitobacterium hafniense DCB-2]|uniref:Sigma54 specific transcriptional regulator, Fis family n=1 Tax=Desulfitobacterium hafniense (strain DSM 10664 / DCB-2) TaxID=272564 RepID=B8FV05_DESHD|nr:sigma-54-dependent Fis family transcriptional regulator [Desulfitobacterium hafniense]ACL18651.1 sigma54 specific transcriptional regulator, Fis family [Desulfitobacterium hafniense DCB-2]
MVYFIQNPSLLLSCDNFLKQENKLSTNLWDEVKDSKRKFIEENVDPRLDPIIPREVAESWIVAKNQHLDPYVKSFEVLLEANKFEKVIAKKADLVETASNYIHNFHEILNYSNFIMVLTDENGVVLLIEGSKKEIEAFNKLNIRLSSLLNEKIIGTSAHTLCIRHRKPIQFIGPYNYSMILQDNISSATPIFNDHGSVIGTLVVVQMLARKDMQNIQAHSLGWVMAMGYAIENLLELKKQNNSMTLMNGTLEATLSLIDDGVITVNENCYISHINKEGINILASNPQEKIIGRHLSEFVKDDQLIIINESIHKGRFVQEYETIFMNRGRDTQYLLNIRPIADGQGKYNSGAVIRLSRSDKVNRMVANRGGTPASFKFEDIKGKSTSLAKSIQIAQNVARTGYNVLLIGESGTGKELFAQSIHNSYKADGPFVAVNCASLPRNLIESELFGYEGGTFTGADRNGRPGKIELANGGTLFLDEIGDMPLEIQPVLLRVLEEKRVTRLGGSRGIPVDFRVIAATNKNLSLMVKEKTFREDLYFRLSIFKITIPPLRERDHDVILLAEYFIEDISKKLMSEVPKLSPASYQKIKEYSWPGNIRQLQNAMVYGVNMSTNGVIELSNLPDEMTSNDYFRTKVNTRKLTLAEIEKEVIFEALSQTGNDASEASRILGIGRTTIYRKLKEYGIDIK